MRKLAFDLNYCPKGYIPEKEESPLLVSNLLNPPEKNIPEEKEKKEEESKRQRRRQKRISKDTSR